MPSTGPRILSQTFGSIDPSLVINQDHLAAAVPDQLQPVVGRRRVHHAGSGRHRPAPPEHRIPQGRQRRLRRRHRQPADGPDGRRDRQIRGSTRWRPRSAAELRQAGIAVVTVPVDGAARAWRPRPRPTPTTWPWSPGRPARSRPRRRPGTRTSWARPARPAPRTGARLERPRGRPAVRPGGPGAQPGDRSAIYAPDRRPAVGPDGGPAPVRRAGLRGQRRADRQCPVQPVDRRHPVERGRCGPC